MFFVFLFFGWGGVKRGLKKLFMNPIKQFIVFNTCHFVEDVLISLYFLGKKTLLELCLQKKQKTKKKSDLSYLPCNSISNNQDITVLSLK